MSKGRITHSSGNVFADLGLPDADEALAKADLAIEIGRVIAQHGWTQTEAADRLGISQSNVSLLLRGRLEGFSTDRLLRFLNRLDRDVEIAIRPISPARPHARVRVRVEEEPSPIAAVPSGEGDSVP